MNNVEKFRLLDKYAFGCIVVSIPHLFSNIASIDPELDFHSLFSCLSTHSRSAHSTSGHSHFVFYSVTLFFLSIWDSHIVSYRMTKSQHLSFFCYYLCILFLELLSSLEESHMLFIEFDGIAKTFIHCNWTDGWWKCSSPMACKILRRFLFACVKHE